MQVTYKCSKEQIHTHMKNAFIDIQGRIYSYTYKKYKCSKEQIPTHMKNTFIHIQGIQVNKTHTYKENNYARHIQVQQRVGSYPHEEYIHTHTRNTSKQETYKCRKEQIYIHIKNIFIDIQRIQVNKTHAHVEKNTFIHISRIQVNNTHTNTTKNAFIHIQVNNIHTQEYSKNTRIYIQINNGKNTQKHAK